MDGAEICPVTTFHIKNKSMAGDWNAESYRGAFRFRCVQYRAAGALRGRRAFQSLDAGGGHGGVLSSGGWRLRFSEFCLVDNSKLATFFS